MDVKHTFAVCAYKESEHLESCIQSLLNQTIRSKIYISTSTPNAHIYSLAKKYNLQVFETNEPSDIQNDWNKAVSFASTPLVTVAHQDDLYDEDYAKTIVSLYNKNPNSVMFFTDYLPIKQGKIGKRDLNSKIRRVLRIPLKFDFLSKYRIFKVASLSLGNSICCPSVTYNLDCIPSKTIFTSELKFALDWDTFLKFARTKYSFGYIDKPLVYYRVYDGATTKSFIVNHTREIEDEYMFNQIWPSFLSKLIMKFYKYAYKTYD